MQEWQHEIRPWRFRPFARTAWGWIVASATGIAALYDGPREHMLETFDWYMDRFRDYKVRDFLESLVSVRPNRVDARSCATRGR